MYCTVLYHTHIGGFKSVGWMAGPRSEGQEKRQGGSYFDRALGDFKFGERLARKEAVASYIASKDWDIIVMLSLHCCCLPSIPVDPTRCFCNGSFSIRFVFPFLPFPPPWYAHFHFPFFFWAKPHCSSKISSSISISVSMAMVLVG